MPGRASVRGERRRRAGVEGVGEKRRGVEGGEEGREEGGRGSAVPVWAQRVQDGVL